MGPPMDLQELLLGGEKKALLTEFVRQKLQLRDLIRGKRSGPWEAGDLPDVGVDMVYGGCGSIFCLGIRAWTVASLISLRK